MTLLIGLLPGYETWGMASIVILTLLRFVDGVFLGGEYTGANPLAMEYAPKEKRGKWAAFIHTGFPLSLAAMSLITTGLLRVLPAGSPHSPYVQWGWRIPVLPRSPVCRRGLPLLRQKGSGIERVGQGGENQVSAEGTVPRRQFPLPVASVPGHERGMVHAERGYVHSSRRSVDCPTREQRRRHQRAIGRESSAGCLLCSFRHVGSEDRPPDHPGADRASQG